MSSFRGSAPGPSVPAELSATGAQQPGTSIQQFSLRDSLVVAAPRSGDWSKEELQGLKEQGLQEIPERRFWHKAYMANFPNPLPSHQGHQPAILQPTGVQAHLLMAEDNPSKVPRAVFMSKDQVQQRNADVDWAGKRDQLLAFAAAGVHGVNFLVHYMNLQWRYLDHKYAPQHEHIYSQFGNW